MMIKFCFQFLLKLLSQKLSASIWSSGQYASHKIRSVGQCQLVRCQRSLNRKTIQGFFCVCVCGITTTLVTFPPKVLPESLFLIEIQRKLANAQTLTTTIIKAFYKWFYQSHIDMSKMLFLWLITTNRFCECC